MSACQDNGSTAICCAGIGVLMPIRDPSPATSRQATEPASSRERLRLGHLGRPSRIVHRLAEHAGLLRSSVDHATTRTLSS
jgi:hypothetical protein